MCFYFELHKFFFLFFFCTLLVQLGNIYLSEGWCIPIYISFMLLHHPPPEDVVDVHENVTGGFQKPPSRTKRCSQAVKDVVPLRNFGFSLQKQTTLRCRVPLALISERVDRLGLQGSGRASGEDAARGEGTNQNDPADLGRERKRNS